MHQKDVRMKIAKSIISTARLWKDYLKKKGINWELQFGATLARRTGCRDQQHGVKLICKSLAPQDVMDKEPSSLAASLDVRGQ